MKKIAFLILMTLLSQSVFTQDFVNENVDIEVCFTANHTYVSDLGFYLIAPGNENNSPGNYGMVQLLPAASDWGPTAAQGSWTGIPWETLGCSDPSSENTTCQSGNDVENFCFTSEFPSANPEYTACVCDMATPLTGDFASVEAWDSVYAFPIVGSWGVSIFDCEEIDIGSLLGATITFRLNETDEIITYQLNPEFEELINDNSCNLQDASKLFFTPEIPCNLTIDMTHDPTDLSYDFTGNVLFQDESVPFSIFEAVDSIVLNEIVKISDVDYQATYSLWQNLRSEPVEIVAVYDLGATPPQHLNLILQIVWENTVSGAYETIMINHEVVYGSEIFTNVNESLAESISIYPNLVENVLYLESKVLDLEYQLMNVSGQVVFKGNVPRGKTQINLQSLSSGQYFFILRNEDGVYSEKIQKM